MNSDDFSRMLIFFAIILVLTTIAKAAPPTPHNVRGFVFHNGSGVGVANGIPVLINDTTAGTTTITQVFSPPVAPGGYSTTINGNTGDTIVVFAWNITHYGTASRTLGNTTTINLTLNLSRGPEVNVSIISPSNNAVRELGELFNITVNVTALIASGTNCTVTIHFWNSSVVNISAGENLSHNLGNISVNASLLTNFSVQAYGVGSTNITVNGTCMQTNVFFITGRNYTLSNLTVTDTIPPLVTLLSPSNNTLNTSSQDVSFVYNVTDNATVVNCSLYLNDTLNSTDTGIIKGANMSFNLTLPNGNYNWSVVCFDPSGNRGNSSVYYLNISVNRPYVFVTDVTLGIVLNAGSTKNVSCNITVDDANGADDISFANATFHYHANTSSGTSDDTFRYHNSSCTLVNTGINTKDFQCSYIIWYFAQNGTWYCNATATDSTGLIHTNWTNTTIDPLYALNVTPTLLDFGVFEAGNFSDNMTQNVSNIGNVPINVSVYGFGGSPGDGNIFSCNSSNITVNNAHFARHAGFSYSAKTALSSTPRLIGFTVPKQYSQGTPRFNETYWELFAPKNVTDIGECVGSIVYQAEMS